MNDLIGLQYSWSSKYGDGTGAINCALLAAEVHKRLGYYDYTNEVIAILSKHTENNFPKRNIVKWLLDNGKRLKKPEPHAIVLMPGVHVGALGTLTDDASLLFISKQFGVILAKHCHPVGHFFKLHK